MAVVSRFHPDVELTSLLLQSGLRQARPLFGRKVTGMTEKLLAQQDGQLRKQPPLPPVFQEMSASECVSPLVLNPRLREPKTYSAACHFQTFSWREKQLYKLRAEVYQQQKQA